MRVIVLFDLPVETHADRQAYTRFRKFLIKDGFLMLQQSVYVKLALNQTAEQAIKERIKKNKPTAGLVQILSITEKQYNAMEHVLGRSTSETLDTDERIVIL